MSGVKKWLSVKKKCSNLGKLDRFRMSFTINVAIKFWLQKYISKPFQNFHTNNKATQQKRAFCLLSLKRAWNKFHAGTAAALQSPLCDAFVIHLLLSSAKSLIKIPAKRSNNSAVVYSQISFSLSSWFIGCI
jgi:hypothetical protein